MAAIGMGGCGGGGSVGLPATQPIVAPADAAHLSEPTNTSRVEQAVQPATTGSYPIYSSLFRGSNNPFHMTVATLISWGAWRHSQTVMNNLWSQGFYDEGVLNAPIYPGRSGEASYMVSCTYYSSRGCSAQNQWVRFPQGAYPQSGSDHHISSVDLVSQGEFDGWGGAGGSQGCVPSYGRVSCTWGGWYPFTGKGLNDNGSSANHGGYAFGLFAITAQEILNGHIDHALGLNTACLDNPSVYPASTTNSSDYTCSGGGGASPSATYGELVHLRLSASQIAALPDSWACKTVLNALATYGAYTYDIGNGALELLMEDPQTYSYPNPWYTKIFPAMASAGEGWGSGASFGWKSCLNHLNAGNFEVLTIPNLGY